MPRVARRGWVRCRCRPSLASYASTIKLETPLLKKGSSAESVGSPGRAWAGPWRSSLRRSLRDEGLETRTQTMKGEVGARKSRTPRHNLGGWKCPQTNPPGERRVQLQTILNRIHLRRNGRGLQQQGETDHQKSIRLQKLPNGRNSPLPRPRQASRAHGDPQILLRRQKN